MKTTKEKVRQAIEIANDKVNEKVNNLKNIYNDECSEFFESEEWEELWKEYIENLVNEIDKIYNFKKQ